LLGLLVSGGHTGPPLQGDVENLNKKNGAG